MTRFLPPTHTSSMFNREEASLSKLLRGYGCRRFRTNGTHDAWRDYRQTSQFLTRRSPRPRFGHGAEAVAPDGTVLLGSYHPSQTNTFTGTSTEAMFDEVLIRARQLADDESPGHPVAGGT